jgi:serine/threonine protein kinase
VEDLDGMTLKYLIAARSLKIEAALSLGIEIADVLDSVHQAGIVHRYIKPADIFVTKSGHAGTTQSRSTGLMPSATSVVPTALGSLHGLLPRAEARSIALGGEGCERTAA